MEIFHYNVQTLYFMNKKNIGLLLLFTLCFVLNSNAQSRTSLKINEVLISNESNFIDSYGEHNAWIEIWNSSYASVDIEGCYLTNDKNNPKKYMIPKSDVLTLIKPRQHILFWADNKPARGTFHVNFTLDPSKENYIALYDSNGKTLIDEILVPANMLPNQSYARVKDGAEAWEIKGKDDNSHVTPSTNNTIELTNAKIEKFEKHDSQGFGMSIIAMSAVFCGLILLYFSFKLTGKIAISMSKRNDMKETGNKAASTSAPKVSTTPQGQDANEDIVAITMALHEHLGGEHDVENMVLTFNEVGPSHSPWSLKIFGLRKR